MFVIPEMRLNRFEPRPIVSNRELFVAHGEKPATVNSKDTSDCYDSPSIVGASKTKVLGLAADIVSKAQAHHDNGGVDPLSKSTKNL